MLQAALDTGSLSLFPRWRAVLDSAGVVDCVLEEDDVAPLLGGLHPSGRLGRLFLDQEVAGARLLLLLPHFSSFLLVGGEAPRVGEVVRDPNLIDC